MVYANMGFKVDFTKWDGHNAEELRDQIIRDLFRYLGSGECPEDCEPQYRETLGEFQAENVPDRLKSSIQDYYFDLFDAMEFWDADPEKTAGEEFPIYYEVLGLCK